MEQRNIILQISDLHTKFFLEEGIVSAVDGVDLTLHEKETLAVVGESGSGKSVTALSILTLIQGPTGRITHGSIEYGGRNLLELDEREMRKIRGGEISMIFQEPMTSLNPVLTIGKQIREVLKYHQGINKKEGNRKAVEMLKLVGIPNPEKCINNYPYQLSGGMRQRAMIAMALTCNPKILIADEPTTALDVSIQSQIIKLLVELKKEINTAIMLITHDLGVVAQLADNVMVMYMGKAVEYGDVKSIFATPYHPYTRELLNSIPPINVDYERLKVIQGVVPSPFNLPTGCKFSTRCPDVMDICRQEEPEYLQKEHGRKVRCWKYSKGR